MALGEGKFDEEALEIDADKRQAATNRRRD
jgi:hypothetical protein